MSRVKETIERDGPPLLSMVVKADVDGSLEAILSCLDAYDDGTRDVPVKLDLIDFGVGDVTEGDVLLGMTTTMLYVVPGQFYESSFTASNFDGVIYAFNTPVSDAVRKKAEEIGVAIKEHNIIYKLVDDLKEELNEHMPMKDVEHVIGKASIKQEFLINVKNQKVPGK